MHKRILSLFLLAFLPLSFLSSTLGEGVGMRHSRSARFDRQDAATNRFVAPSKEVRRAKDLPLRPGTVASEATIRRYGADRFFTQQAISDSVFSLMRGKSFPASQSTHLASSREGGGEAVRRQDLRYLTCLHRDAQGVAHVGEMVVNKQIANTVLRILRQLYDAAYPIERMVLIDNYDADDEASMSANNSTGFNYRTVAGTKTISKHALGLAVDINPLYNPYVKPRKAGRKAFVQPACATPYTDRSRTFTYKIQRGDLCHRLFTTNGFVWGGAWRSCKDYQHFESK